MITLRQLTRGRRAAAASLALLAAVTTAAWGASARQEKKKAASQPPEKGWVSLFNGKNLDGWTPKVRGYPLGENYGDTFRVEKGVIKVAYDRYPQFDGKFGHLFYKQKYRNYRLRIEYRFVGEQATGGPGWAQRNSGVMIHCQTPESMRKDQDFPVSLEVQFLGGTEGKGERPTGNLCTPGTVVTMDGKPVAAHCVNSRSKTYNGEQWVTSEVEVRGAKLRHLVNGEEVLAYEKPELDDKDADARALITDGRKELTGGYLALQAESHPVEFRKVEIMPLPD